MSETTLSSGWQAVLGFQRSLEKQHHVDAVTLGVERAFTDALSLFSWREAVSGNDFGREFEGCRESRIRRVRRDQGLAPAYAEHYVRTVRERLAFEPSTEADRQETLARIERLVHVYVTLHPLVLSTGRRRLPDPLREFTD